MGPMKEMERAWGSKALTRVCKKGAISLFAWFIDVVVAEELFWG